MSQELMMKKFFEQYFGELHPNANGEVLVKCPFHDDVTPSMSINLKKGGLWNCFASSCGKTGDIYTFCQLSDGIDFPVAQRKVQEFFEQNLVRQTIEEAHDEELNIDEDIVQGYHDNLQGHPEVILYLTGRRGITEETISNFKIGWDGDRITIPILWKNKYVNVRRYKIDAKEQKMINYRTGYGKSRLFPEVNLNNSPILLCAGEWDCLVAIQKGFNAITTTTGEGSWKAEWTPYFRSKIVNIVYDVDTQGQIASSKIAEVLQESTNQVKVINLPSDKKGYDISDYFVKDKKTAEDLQKLINDTPFFEPPIPLIQVDENVYNVHLSQVSNEEYFNKKIKFDAVVAGKDLQPFLVTKKIKISCPVAGRFEERCPLCGLGIKGERTVEFDIRDAIVLQLVDISESQLKGIIKKAANVFSDCRYSVIDKASEEKMNVEEIYLIPTIDFSSTGTEYVLRRCFYVGKDIQSNKAYSFTGITYPEPKRQYATQLIFEAVPSQDSITTFKFTPEMKETLEIFQPKENQTVKQKFHEIAKDLTYNVTKIYGREDVIIGMDLVFHSVLQFQFGDKLLGKGWMECLVIGDTRTGKTESAQALINHYRIGEFITAENSSYAGLIGGMQQTGTNKTWNITWGKIPLNDTRLVVIDELSSMALEDLANMSGVRSSGVAEITKIRTEKTNARTRAIYLSNPRDDKKMNSKKYGIMHVKTLIGKPEDIARFDFVVSCRSDEIDINVVNSAQHAEVEHIYKTANCRNLILWTWSRKPEQILFEPESITKILKYAIRMGKIYDNEIPIVDPAEIRIKIAKIAVATAARLYSCDETGEKIIVKPEHVEFVYDFLNTSYKKKSLSYYQMSIENWRKKIAIQENRVAINEFIQRNLLFCQRLISSAVPRTNDIQQMFPGDVLDTAQRINFLKENHLIESTPVGHKVNPIFIEIVRDYEMEIGTDIEEKILREEGNE